VEIETGKPTPKSLIIRDYGEVKRKYTELINEAEKEIAILISSEGLDEVLGYSALLKEKAQKGVSIKIMLPITKNNLERVSQLSEFCKFRHISNSYLNTTIIDRMHIFQFKDPSSNQKNLVESNFENTFYTNDLEYVEKLKNMLDEVWRNATTPSGITVEQITKPSISTVVPVPDDEYSASRLGSPLLNNTISFEQKPDAITEEYVLNKIINSRKTLVKDPLRDFSRFYGNTATAVIHPPEKLKLPDMLLIFAHLTKQSSYGVEDWFQVYLQRETSKGYVFSPVAIVGDNQRAMKRRQLSFAGTPAEHNCQILRKDEIQVQLNGNKLFASWSVPIPLYNNEYILPPGSLLLEGYGRLKTVLTTVVMPSGAKTIMEGSGFDAFVTFFHPESRYAGSGTDGIIGRDLVMTYYPPAVKL